MFALSRKIQTTPGALFLCTYYENPGDIRILNDKKE